MAAWRSENRQRLIEGSAREQLSRTVPIYFIDVTARIAWLLRREALCEWITFFLKYFFVNLTNTFVGGKM